MRDKGKRDGINSRVVFEYTLCELGQLMVITPGQILTNLSQLLLNDMEVIDQPLGRR